MTEAEWLAGTGPRPMLVFLRAGASERKLRLLAVACCDHVRNYFPHGFVQRTVRVGERYADGQVGREALMEAREVVEQAAMAASRTRHESLTKRNIWWLPAYAVIAEDTSLRDLIPRVVYAATHAVHPQEPLQVCPVIRCLFGNPFRPVTFSPAWLTPTAVGLAKAIYADRAFDRLPILADAMQDAGCEDVDVLSHCRSDGVHVRGCWVVDGVLGKG